MKKILLLVVILLFTFSACTTEMGVSKGGEIKNDEEGFSVVVPKGYEVSSSFGEMALLKAGADVYEGPAFNISVSSETTDKDMDKRLDYFNTPDVNLLHNTYNTTHIPITVAGIEGRAVDFTGKTEEKGVAISGRDAVANLPNGRYLYFSGNWPAKDQDTYLKVFNDLLSSLKFYEPIAPTAKP